MRLSCTSLAGHVTCSVQAEAEHHTLFRTDRMAADELRKVCGAVQSGMLRFKASCVPDLTSEFVCTELYGSKKNELKYDSKFYGMAPCD